MFCNQVQFSSWDLKRNPNTSRNCTEQFLEYFTPLQIFLDCNLKMFFSCGILAFSVAARVFVLNIFWNGRLIILHFSLKHWPYFLSTRNADRRLIGLHFPGFSVPAGLFVLATGQPWPQGHLPPMQWILFGWYCIYLFEQIANYD